jgi:hypothetical protein
MSAPTSGDGEEGYETGAALPGRFIIREPLRFYWISKTTILDLG